MCKTMPFSTLNEQLVTQVQLFFHCTFSECLKPTNVKEMEKLPTIVLASELNLWAVQIQWDDSTSLLYSDSKERTHSNYHHTLILIVLTFTCRWYTFITTISCLNSFTFLIYLFSRWIVCSRIAEHVVIRLSCFYYCSYLHMLTLRNECSHGNVK